MVTQGAAEPPKFIHLTYKPKGDIKKKVPLISRMLTYAHVCSRTLTYADVR